ncbi:retropepsin-like aspartic protease [Streptomyces tailanensis]|uniref:retropepsin-like aspartic protease n=1 Tax=Streptomyces tailanensis TaxID=2569858 RepID=UPI001FE8E878
MAGWALRPHAAARRRHVRHQVSVEEPTRCCASGRAAARGLHRARRSRQLACEADLPRGGARGAPQGRGAGRPDAGVRPGDHRRRGPFKFALDTGASTSVVDDDVADRVGLEPTGERRSVSGVLGSGQVPVAQVGQWEVGDVRLDPGEVTVIDLGPPGEGGSIQGLLGSDMLSDFGSITIDYDDSVLTIPAP